jgi:ubiquinone/menaquinone biosynthesis C-methylase UbiE
MTVANPDFETIKSRQQAAWATGDYAVIGTTLQLVGESLCEAVDVRAGQRVIDVAAGTGNATLAAARRGCDVVSTDYLVALLDRGKTRASAEGVQVRFEHADAENLPFAGGEFDVALSTFGAMFAPDQDRTAAELTRVVRQGGKIGLANWTPDGFVGEMFKTISRRVPPAAGLRSPFLWGTDEHLRERLFAGLEVSAVARKFMFRYRSPRQWLETFRRYYGPMTKVFAALDIAQQRLLTDELLELVRRFNTTQDGSMVAAGAYLEVVVSV